GNDRPTASSRCRRRRPPSEDNGRAADRTRRATALALSAGRQSHERCGVAVVPRSPRRGVGLSGAYCAGRCARGGAGRRADRPGAGLLVRLEPGNGGLGAGAGGLTRERPPPKLAPLPALPGPTRSGTLAVPTPMPRIQRDEVER